MWRTQLVPSVALLEVPLEPLRPRAVKAIDELHQIRKHDQPLLPKPANDRILKRRGILMLVGDHDGVAPSVGVIQRRELLQQCPKQRSEVVEHQPPIALFVFHGDEKSLERLGLGRPLVAEAFEAMLGETLNKTLVPPHPRDGILVSLLQRTDSEPSAGDLSPER